MKQMRLAVTGVPACGKTTLCARLGPYLKAEVIDLNKVVEEEGLYERFDKARDTRVVDVKKLCRRVGKIAKADVILDGLLSHHLNPTHILVLRCDPRLLAERMRCRGYSRGKIMENVEAEYMGVISDEAFGLCPNVLEADNTGGVSLGDVKKWLNKGGAIRTNVDWSSEFVSVLGSIGNPPI